MKRWNYENSETMENLNKIDLRLASNVKNYLKRISKPSYMSRKCLGMI